MKHSPVSSQSHHYARKTSHEPYNSSQQIFNNRGQARTLTNPPINPYGVPHAVLKMVSGIASNVKPPPSVVPASCEATPSANQWKAPQPQCFPSPDPSTSQFSQGVSSLKGHGASTSTSMLNPLPTMKFPSPLPSIANYPFHPCYSPASSQMIIPHPNVGPSTSSQQPSVGHTDLFTSLISHGVISLDKQLPAQVSSMLKRMPCCYFSKYYLS